MDWNCLWNLIIPYSRFVLILHILSFFSPAEYNHYYCCEPCLISAWYANGAIIKYSWPLCPQHKKMQIHTSEFWCEALIQPGDDIDISLIVNRSMVLGSNDLLCAAHVNGALFLSPMFLACRRTPRWCTMPCTWWPWLCSSLSRSLSAHYSATDTSPGASGTASWPSSKR